LLFDPLPGQLTATQHLCHLYGVVSPDQARCIVYQEHQLHLLVARGERGREGDVLQTISKLYLCLGTEKYVCVCCLCVCVCVCMSHKHQKCVVRT